MGTLHGVRRLVDGRLRVRLTLRERDLLRTLPAQLRAVLAGTGGPAQARARLFPAAHVDDPLAELEYRELVGDDLEAERLAAVDAFAASLETGRSGRLGWTVELDTGQADAWLSAVNDARLVLGMVLGIADEHDWEDRRRGGDPIAVLLDYLGMLEEELLGALAGGLA